MYKRIIDTLSKRNAGGWTLWQGKSGKKGGNGLGQTERRKREGENSYRRNGRHCERETAEGEDGGKRKICALLKEGER